MLIQIVFWVLIAIDIAALGLFFLLGLAAGPSSKTSPFAIAAFMLPIPGLLLLASIGLFVFTRSPLSRSLAFLTAAAPLLFVVGSHFYTEYEISQYKDKDGNITHRFKPGPMREVEEAIVRNNAPAVAAAARTANLKQSAIDGASVLVVALRHLEKHPAPPEVLRALLQAGADPNARQRELPLHVAIQISRKTGPESVRLLLDAGADPNASGDFGQPAFFMATAISVDSEVLRLLLDRGVNVNAKSRDGHTAIFDAVNSQNWTAVKTLIDRGIDWKQYRALNGMDLLTRLESDARNDFGNKEGLAELIQFVRSGSAAQ